MNKRRDETVSRTASMFPAKVRRWLYGVAAAAAPLCTIYGLVSEQQAVLWLNLLGAVLFTMAVGNTPTRPDEQVTGESE